MDVQAEKKIKDELSYLGVGPKIFVCISPFILIFAIISFLFEPNFQFPIESFYLSMLGTVFLIIGIISFVYSEMILRKAFNASQLLTTKIFAFIRHPLYASMGLGILPGILFILNSWLLFLILPIYYLLVRIFIREEESYLENKFGDKYVQYKEKVNAFFPKFKNIKQIILKIDNN